MLVTFQNEKKSEKEPMLIFTGRVSRCAGGYHIKVRPTDVNSLHLEGTIVRVELYRIDVVDSRMMLDDPMRAKLGTSSIEEETRQIMFLADSIEDHGIKRRKR